MYATFPESHKYRSFLNKSQRKGRKRNQKLFQIWLQFETANSKRILMISSLIFNLHVSSKSNKKQPVVNDSEVTMFAAKWNNLICIYACTLIEFHVIWFPTRCKSQIFIERKFTWIEFHNRLKLTCLREHLSQADGKTFLFEQFDLD